MYYDVYVFEKLLSRIPRVECVRFGGVAVAAVVYGRRDDEKEETDPFPRFGVWGAPVCLFLSGVV